MIIKIKVKTKAREERITKTGENNFAVFVKELPIKGKANEVVIKLLAEYFNISKSRIKIISGKTAKNKLVKIIN